MKISASDTSDSSADHVRAASSCAWNVPSSCVRVALRQCASRRRCVGCRRRSRPCRAARRRWPMTTMRRCAFSRWIWLGPSPLLDFGEQAQRHMPGRRRDQADRRGRWSNGSRRQAASRRRSGDCLRRSARRRGHSTAPSSASADRGRRDAVERRALVVDGTCGPAGSSTCFSTCRSTSPATPADARAASSASDRSVSRSSPKIFSAICARTPDSMWSRRCAIGWPMLIDTGSIDELGADVRVHLFLGAGGTCEVDIDLASCARPRRARRARHGRCGGRPSATSGTCA